MPVLTSRGGATESSKLKSGRVEFAVEDAVVDRRRSVAESSPASQCRPPRARCRWSSARRCRGALRGAAGAQGDDARDENAPCPLPHVCTLGNTDQFRPLEVRGERVGPSVMSVFPGVQACTKAAPRRELVEGPGTFFAKSLAGRVGLLLLVWSMRVAAGRWRQEFA